MTKLNYLKKLLLAPKWGLLPGTGPSHLYALISESSVNNFLKFCLMIGHYKLKKSNNSEYFEESIIVPKIGYFNTD